jgi:hypothetical protein
MKTFFASCLFAGIIFSSCTNNNSEKQEPQVSKEEKIKAELKIIDSLLQDEQFAEQMAMELEASYYKGVGEAVPPFLKPGEDSLQIDKSVREEKIATNLAGFYALECGLNYLCADNSSTPLDWIALIVEQKLIDSNVLLLNRLANATWKAGQPFRGLERIKRPNFISASALSDDEVKKDWRQIIGAANKLNTALHPGTKDEQLEQLRSFLQSKEFAFNMALHMDSSYNASENKPVPAFLTDEEMIGVKKKSFKEEKIAMNVAGFYALECATNFLVTSGEKTPSEILQSLIDDKISKEDKLLFARFANATWKAGQPFRGLDRIKRETFTAFNFLSEADIEKDLVQVKAAAKKLLEAFK